MVLHTVGPKAVVKGSFKTDACAVAADMHICGGGAAGCFGLAARARFTAGRIVKCGAQRVEGALRHQVWPCSRSPGRGAAGGRLTPRRGGGHNCRGWCLEGGRIALRAARAIACIKSLYIGRIKKSKLVS